MPSEIERFWAKVDKSGDCWLWTAGTRGSYGRFSLEIINSEKQKQVPAHRFSYELHFGEIPEGLLVCHECDVKVCVNPEHLFLGTNQDNTDDMITKGRKATTKGVLNGRSKLDEEIVRCIRKYYPMFTQKQLGLMFFNISGPTISLIVNGITWTHVK